MLRKLDRWSRKAVLAMLLLLPVIIYGAAHVRIGTSGVHQWLPDGRPERERYERFLEDFGTDQFVLISWDGCKPRDPRLSVFHSQLQNATVSPHPLIVSVVSTVQFMEAMTEEPIGLSVAEAVRRLKGTFVGVDGQCALVAQVSEHGLTQQADTMNLLFEAADATEGLGRQRLRMAGTIYEAYSVDQAAERSLKQLVIPSSILGIAIACVCLRSVMAALAVLIIAGIGQLVAMASVYYAGGEFSAVLIVLPTLVFMLTLSGAVHLMNYYVDVSADYQNHLGGRAMLLGFKPSILSSMTTALGMASLTVSQLVPVREFGIYSSVTLCLSTLFLLMSFPSLSDWFYGRQAVKIAVSKRSVCKVDDEVSHESPVARRYTGWMQRWAIAVSAAGFALILVSVYGLSFLTASTRFDDMFPAGSPTVRDMVWLEQKLGPISSIEVLLRFQSDCQLDTFDRALWVNRLTNHIRSDKQLKYALSATTFLPTLPQGGSFRDVAKRSVLRKTLGTKIDRLCDEGWVAQSAGCQIWRVTVKVAATSEDDYGIQSDRVHQAVKSLPLAQGERVPFSFEVTGLSLVIRETQLTLIDDLGISFTAAFILITPVMMIIARGFWAGLLIMLPNVLPETVVFGSMAWLGLRLDIAGLLTASVAMGIAVNDTLHFVNWYARRLALGDSRTDAIVDTLTSCAGAMFHTMLISCCSMLPFLFSDFLPTRQFAFLMIAMLGSSILGDLVLLPALLLSPLGLCFVPRNCSSRLLEAVTQAR